MSDQGTVAQLLGVVEDLAERLERLERGEEPGAHPALWLLSDAVVSKEDADGAWAQFVSWVVRLQQRYELGTSRLPACWLQHPAVVEELVALWLGHVDAYAQAGYAPMSWHDGFERTLTRIKGMWAAECLNGSHDNPHRAKPWKIEDFSKEIAAGAPLPWAAPTRVVPAPTASPTDDPTNPVGS